MELRVVLFLALLALVGTSQGPCDLYDEGKTPCVAAFSTVRAMYGSYHGGMYQVQRTSDSKTVDIKTMAAGGFADSASQDSFCTGTSCAISRIYDQSPQGGRE